MPKVIFSTEQVDFLRSASDLLLRNTGAVYLKDIAALLSKLETQTSDLDSRDLKLIRVLCDAALKASGVLQLVNVIAILNMTTENKEMK